MMLLHLNHTKSRRVAGFTFLEVLFAIMILGIGFILVAAMFPAAIKQTQATVEDSASSSIWVATHRKFIELAHTPQPNPPPPGTAKTIFDADMPGKSIVYSFNDSRNTNYAELARLVGSELILDTDQRYGCVPFFQRATNSLNVLASEVELILIPIRCRTKTQYDLSDITNGYLNPTLFSGVKIHATSTTDSSVVLEFGSVSNNSALGTGAYLIVSDCPLRPTKNGSIYRLGECQNPSAGTPIYSVAPDAQNAIERQIPPTDPTTNADGTLTVAGYTASVFVVGRASVGGGTYDGGVQDIGIATVPIRVKFN